MKTVVYFLLIVSATFGALFTVSQLSTAKSILEFSVNKEDPIQLEEGSRPLTGPLTNGFTHTGVIPVGGTDTWTIPSVAVNDSITARVGNVNPTGLSGDFYPRIRVIRPMESRWATILAALPRRPRSVDKLQSAVLTRSSFRKI